MASCKFFLCIDLLVDHLVDILASWPTLDEGVSLSNKVKGVVTRWRITQIL